LLLERMKSQGFPFSRLVGVSGSGQQHGSVYWRQGSAAVLESLAAEQELAPQLEVRGLEPSSGILPDMIPVASL
jgi:xylulokinase